MLRRAILNMFHSAGTRRTTMLLQKVAAGSFIKNNGQDALIKDYNDYIRHKKMVTEDLNERLDLGRDAVQKLQYENGIIIFDSIIKILENDEGSQQGVWKLILAEAFAQKGMILSKSGDIQNMEKGEAYIRHALTLNPSNELAKETMDAILFDKGEMPENRIRPQ